MTDPIHVPIKEPTSLGGVAIASVELPCEQCAHKPVCRIREGLSAPLQIVSIELPPELEIIVTATATCDYFLAVPSWPGATPPAGGRERIMEAIAELEAFQPVEPDPEPDPDPDPEPDPEPTSLSARQQKVLRAVLHGGSISAAARELGWSNSTTNAAMHEIGRRGGLPLDLIGHLPASFAKYARVSA